MLTGQSPAREPHKWAFGQLNSRQTALARDRSYDAGIRLAIQRWQSLTIVDQQRYLPSRLAETLKHLDRVHPHFKHDHIRKVGRSDSVFYEEGY